MIVTIFSYEQWEQASDVFCPKCGANKVWQNISNDNYEDNAGDYYLCLECAHDWHMYPLSGYLGIEETSKRIEAIKNAS